MNPSVLIDIPKISDRIYEISTTYPSSYKEPVENDPVSESFKMLILTLLLRRMTSMTSYWKPSHLRIESTEDFASCLRHAKDTKLGNGVFGTVYKIKSDACSCFKHIPAETPFVAMKVEPVILDRYYGSQSPQGIATSVKLSKLAGKHGIGPAFYDAFLTRDINGYIQIIKVFEYIDGTNWKKIKWNSSEKKLDALQQLEILIQKMNKIGIIHNDLHSGNVMISKEEKVYIIDFDLASFYKDVEKDVIDFFNTTDDLENNMFSWKRMRYIYDKLVKEGSLLLNNPIIKRNKTKKAKRS